jgi:VanZ family protein
MKRIFVYWDTAAWTAIMLVLFLFPSQGIPSVAIPYQDKFAHIVLFAVFTILYLRGRMRAGSLRTFAPRHIITTFIIVMAFAVSVEILQEIMPLGRDGDVTDTLHDFAGFLCGSLFMVLIYGIRPRRL